MCTNQRVMGVRRGGAVRRGARCDRRNGGEIHSSAEIKGVHKGVPVLLIICVCFVVFVFVFVI